MAGQQPFVAKVGLFRDVTACGRLGSDRHLGPDVAVLRQTRHKTRSLKTLHQCFGATVRGLKHHLELADSAAALQQLKRARGLPPDTAQRFGGLRVRPMRRQRVDAPFEPDHELALQQMAEMTRRA